MRDGTIAGRFAGRGSARTALAVAAFGVAGLCAGTPAWAASQTWKATPTDANWLTTTNWGGGAVPGTTSGTTNDVATFNATVTNGFGTTTALTIDSGRRIGGIAFDTANASSYTIGTNAGNALTLSTLNFAAGYGTHSISLSASVVSPQTIAAPINFVQPSSSNGQFAFLNNASSATATLTLSGALTLNASRPAVTVLDGSNTGANTISGAFNYSGTTQGAPYIIKRGAGTWILTAANTFSGTSATGSGGIQILDGVLRIQNSAALGTNASANTNQVYIGNRTFTYNVSTGNDQTYTSTAGGTLELANGIVVDNGLSLNLYNGGTIQSSGSNGTNGRINVDTTANTAVSLSTVSAADVFTIGNGTNDLTGGAADTVIKVGGPGTVFQNVASNYAGGWSVNAGTLKLGSATALGSAATANVAFGAGSTGKLQLNGNNATVVGLNTNATPGTAVIENNAAGTSTLTVSNALANAFAGTLQNGAAGTLALTKGGTGSLSLTASNTYSGATTISGGTLLANNTSGSATGSGNVAVNAGGTLGGTGTVGGAVTVAASGRIAPGSGGVGTLTVGTMSLSSGSQLDYDIASTSSYDSTAVSTSGGLTLNGGQFNLNGGTAPFLTNGVYNLIGYSGAIGGTGVSALSLNTNNQDLANKSYLFGTAGGFVTLTVANSGITPSAWVPNADGVWSDGANWSNGVPNAASAFASLASAITAPRTVTVDGPYTVGTLAFNNSNAYTVAPGTNGVLTLDNGASTAFVTAAAGSHAVQVPLALTGNGANVTVTQSNDVLTVSGGISGSGAVVKNGVGTLSLTGSSSYTGGTTLNSGLLQIDSPASLGDSGGSLVFNGGTLGLLANVTTSRNYQIGGTANALFDTNNNDLTLAGTLTPLGGAAGGVIKTGSGTLTLGGTNTYTGTTTINGGIVSVAANHNLGDAATGAGVVLNGGMLAGTATFTLDNAGSSARPITGTGGVYAAPSTTLTVPGLISGGTITKSGSGALVVTNTANASAFVVSEGTLTAGNTNPGNGGLGTGAITLQNGATLRSNMGADNSLGFNNTLTVAAGQTGNLITPNRFNWTGTIAGGGTLNVTASSTVSRFDFNNTFTGFTGTINLAGSGTVRLLNNGGSFNTNSFQSTTLDLGGTVFVSPQTNTTGNTYPIGALSGSSTTANLGGGTAGAATYQVGALNASTSYAGLISGNSVLTKVGTGNLTLTGANSYTGLTNINAGTLTINGQYALGGANYAGATFNGGTLAYTANLTGTNGTGDITADSNGVAKAIIINSGGATVHTNGNNVTFANPLSGAGAFTKAGDGKLTLNASNTYAGGTTVSGGTLVANGATNALGGGAVNVNTGGTLAGTGTIAAAVSVNAGGTITAGSGATAGDTPGTLTAIGTQTWTGSGTTESAGGTYAWKLGSTASDKLEITLLNIVSTGGKFTVRPVDAGGAFALNTPYTLAHVAGLQLNGTNQTIGSNLTSLFYLDLDGLGYADNSPAFAVAAVSDGGSGFNIQMQAAPEPTVVALAGLATAPLLGRRRRKLHQAA